MHRFFVREKYHTEPVGIRLISAPYPPPAVRLTATPDGICDNGENVGVGNSNPVGPLADMVCKITRSPKRWWRQRRYSAHAPAFSACCHARSASGATPSPLATAWALAAVPRTTRPRMPWRIAASRNILYAT